MKIFVLEFDYFCDKMNATATCIIEAENKEQINLLDLVGVQPISKHDNIISNRFLFNEKEKSEPRNNAFSKKLINLLRNYTDVTYYGLFKNEIHERIMIYKKFKKGEKNNEKIRINSENN